MVIVSVAVVAILLAFTQATKGTITSTNYTEATYLAQQALELLKAQDGKKVIDTTVVVSPVGKYSVVPAPLTVSAISGATDNLDRYLKPYQVTVSWSDATGNKSVKMVGYCYVNP